MSAILSLLMFLFDMIIGMFVVVLTVAGIYELWSAMFYYFGGMAGVAIMALVYFLLFSYMIGSAISRSIFKRKE